MTRPAKPRKPKKVVVWAVVDCVGGEWSAAATRSRAMSLRRTHSDLNPHSRPFRVVRCEGVLR